MVCGTRHIISALLSPMFIIASVLCSCAPHTASAEPSEATHSCCEEEKDKKACHDDSGACVHCGQTSVADNQPVKVPTPVISRADWLPTAIHLAKAVALYERVSLAALPAPRLPYQPSVLRQTCILRI